MDRNKLSSSGRGSKSKLPQHPQDIFALGSKSTVVVPRDSDVKRSIHKPSTSGVERKRESPVIPPPPTKKPKLSSSSSPSELSGASASLEIEPVELVPSVLQALDTHNSDKLLGLLTGAIRLLKVQRWKPDPILAMSLLYLVKIRPNMFSHEVVSQSICTLLKREQGAAFKNKGNPTVFVLACNMLYAGFRDNKTWPEGFVKVYIDDALNERWWVDCVWCKCLVENIVTAFNTKIPPSHLIPSENNNLGTMSPSGSGSPLLVASEDDTDHSELEYSVYPRYVSSYEAVETLVYDAVKEQLNRRGAPDTISKGFLKLMSSTCGFPEIRLMSACRLEAWLHSGKLWRAAQETLAYVCVNVDTSPRDHEVLAQLARMRLKTKPLVAAYIACLKEMVSENPTLLRSVVTHTIYNELSNVRSPNNMAVLAALIQSQPLLAPQAMAETYQELLMRPEEYLRPLRLLTRDTVRAARGEVVVALTPLCRALANPPKHDPPAEVRERAFSSIAELFCLACMITASHSKHLSDYKQQIATIQSESVSWLLDAALPIYRASHQEYTLALHKIMFVEPVETYCRLDNWPPESERALTYRMCCEVPLLQNTLLRIIYIGLAKELPLAPGEAFELIEQLVRRACALPAEENPLPVDKLEIADYIFQLCHYHHPDNITLPAGYTAPSLAITSLYWRAWLLLVMIAAHNPDTFAKQAFHKYPTLKALIEMCITNKFSVDWTTAGDTEAEKASILQLETHLAAASNAKQPITEHTSRLLSQLTIMDSTGEARKPPTAVTECLSTLCSQMRLGRLLCGQSALLLDIVERHGTRKAMPWLHDMLHDEHHSLSVLPVPCLCEFLVAGGGEKARELARHLQRTLTESASGARDVLCYYLARLAHPSASVRQHANRGLKLVLTPVDDDEVSDVEWNAVVSPDEWLPLIFKTPHWESIREEACAAVRAAALAEPGPRPLAAYVHALTRLAQAQPVDSVHHILLDLSQLLMERMTVMAAILPPTDGRDSPLEEETDLLGPHHTLYALTTAFQYYLHLVRTTYAANSASWVSGAESVELEWPTGERCTLHILLAHASIKLLCYGPAKMDTNGALYSWLVSVWISPGPNPESEAILLPDWLRLHLVRSARPLLVQAGLRGLDAHRLALFLQTFGMPVTSVSALLAALDSCPAGALSRLGVERAYMAQLVRVQHDRGATGGEAFANALQLHEPHYPQDTLFEEIDDDIEIFEDILEENFDQPKLTLEQIGPLFATAFLGVQTFSGDVDAAFTCLQSIISEEIQTAKTSSSKVTDCPYIQCIVIYVGMIMRSANCFQFVKGFLGKLAYSVPMMRLLLSCSDTPFEQSLSEVADTLLNHYKLASGPLIAILKEMSQFNKLQDQDMSIVAEKESKSSPFAETAVVLPKEATKENIITVLENCTPNTLEEVGNRIIRTQNPKTVLSAICRILENNQNGVYDIPTIKLEEDTPMAEHIFSSKSLGCGLLIDWMSELQPETLEEEDPQTQMRLMFLGKAGVWRPLLVTLVAHRASWATLHTCLTTLLSEQQHGWQASSVLELVSAVTRSPRVWQGRDKNTPKHHTPEDTLGLTHKQIGALVGYILEEASAPNLAPAEAVKALEWRLALLLRCCGTSTALLAAALAASVSDEPLPAVYLFRALFYMNVPKILRMIADASDDNVDPESLLPPSEYDELVSESVSIVDKVQHTLLTGMTLPTASAKTRSLYEMCARALCSRHWRAARRGRALQAALLPPVSLQPATATAILSTLEAAPDVALFTTDHETIEMILEYFISGKSSGKEQSSIQHRIASLLKRYQNTEPTKSAMFLQKNRALISAIPALSALTSLGRESSSSTVPPGALATLVSGSSGDVLGALHELEAWCSRRGAAGSDAARALAAAAPYARHPNRATRLAATAALVRLLPAAPDPTPGFTVVMQCLDPAYPDVAATILEKLPELIVCMQEHATQILMQAFELGMKSKINTETHIAKCVSTLNTLKGC